MKTLRVLFFTIALFALSSCATVTEFSKNNPEIYDGGIMLLTAEVIDGDADRANDLADLALITKALYADESVVVTEIDDLLLEHIMARNYEPEKEALYLALVQGIRSYIKRKIDAQELDADYMVLIGHTADLVLRVASREQGGSQA